MHRRGRNLLSFGAIAGLIVMAMLLTSDIVSFGGGAGAAVTATSQPRVRTLAQETDTETPASPMESASDVFAAVSPAVVTVLSEAGGGGQANAIGSGTGFIIDDEGHIVTNWHVVTGGEQFEVIFFDGSVHDAELVGSDELSDLAVVRVDDEVPATVGFADSDELLPGEAVLAIGSPLGTFSNTITQGIVSAINRDFPFTGAQGAGSAASQYNNLVQHDAAINPGNSGGPLVNLSGEVVGVNTLGIPLDESGQPVQGLFFAIPSNTVELIAATLIEDGEVLYPFVGVTYGTITPAIAAQLDLESADGVIVSEVVGDGPADEAGLEVDDQIIQIGDFPLNGQTTFSEALFNYDPGDTVTLIVIRDGEEREFEITFDEREV